MPLWQLLSERFNEQKYHKHVPVYATGGHYYPDGDVNSLMEEVKGYLDQGFKTIKIKWGRMILPMTALGSRPLYRCLITTDLDWQSTSTVCVQRPVKRGNGGCLFTI